MKVTVLAYVDQEGSDKCDVVVEQVVDALKAGGHKPSILTVHDDLPAMIAALQEAKPDLVFNLVESFGKDQVGGLMGVAGVLDLLRLRHTGGGPGELYLQEDKALSKKLLAYEQLLYPNFATFAKDSDFETGGTLRMPLFVKPQRNDASMGIDAKTSLVRNATELMERVLEIHKKFDDSALAEEYIDGREFYVGVIGNQDLTAFPPVEMDFSGLPEGAPHVLDSKAKFDESSVEYQGTKAVMADVSDELKAKLQKVATEAYRVLRVRDYGRIDLRLTDTGDIYVIEVNANCYLEKESEFAMSAAADGVDFNTLVNRIADLAIARVEGPKPIRNTKKKTVVKKKVSAA
ncbi:MAG: ATP-grasp domain-containing protein [Planctomycetota bacterium]|nr:ATP-grasp domain-containing protein [Planctomycetaceae bacterium]MDQ3332964.1 ATP-grasp domain-containing protein [Planctomycetota bacterium]